MRILKVLAAAALLAGLAFGAAACDTVNPVTNCKYGRPAGYTPTAIYNARQTVVNGEQFYLCHGSAGGHTGCWGVKHWDHSTYWNGWATQTWCP